MIASRNSLAHREKYIPLPTPFLWLAQSLSKPEFNIP